MNRVVVFDPSLAPIEQCLSVTNPSPVHASFAHWYLFPAARLTVNTDVKRKVSAFAGITAEASPNPSRPHLLVEAPSSSAVVAPLTAPAATAAADVDDVVLSVGGGSVGADGTAPASGHAMKPSVSWSRRSDGSGGGNSGVLSPRPNVDSPNKSTCGSFFFGNRECVWSLW